MLLAYVVCGDVFSAKPILCIVPDKPDQFSSLVPVKSLCVSDNAYLRLSAIESLLVKTDPQDGAFVLEPLAPSKLFITPDLSDKPGVGVRSMKIVVTGPDTYQVFYVQEIDSTGTWKEWSPLKLKTSSYGGSARS